VDIRLGSETASEAEVAALDAALVVALVAGIAPRRDLLLPALHAVADAVGWISPGALNEIARRLDVAPAEVYGVASFYEMFSFEPPPAAGLRVPICTDLSCQLAAGGAVLVPPGGHAVSCLGLCDTAGDGSAVSPRPAGLGELVLLRRVGQVDPTDLDAYRAAGGYEGLRRALTLGPAGVVQELADSRLVGRGGASFPVARKWQAVAANPARPHYLVCNADESEPGTFKDRVLLEGDPFSIIEAMTIAGFATGCERGYLYVRGEYRQAVSVLEQALDAARRRGLLGPDVLGHGVAFDIEVRRGAGAYICGEETALFNSLEGYRGEPRSKPPFPVDVGLFGQPTVVNNVETLANVPVILAGGGAAFARTGTEGSTGTKLFAVSGCVARPGVYEVPFGTTLGELIELAGGVVGGADDGRRVRAVLLGGAAGVFAGPGDLDVPLTFEGTQAAGLTLGSGAVIVLDDRADLEAFLHRIAAFFRAESCGQCVPCRIGTVHQQELLRRVLAGDQTAGDILRDVAGVMRDASICGLGQTAGIAIQSALAKLEVEAR
jgi:NADH-quinone oxidoreductase subunit F